MHAVVSYITYTPINRLHYTIDCTRAYLAKETCPRDDRLYRELASPHCHLHVDESRLFTLRTM